MIPPEHLEDVFTPQRFSELLGQLVDGLPLEVLSVDTCAGRVGVWRWKMGVVQGHVLAVL